MLEAPSGPTKLKKVDSNERAERRKRTSKAQLERQDSEGPERKNLRIFESFFVQNLI